MGTKTLKSLLSKQTSKKKNVKSLEPIFRSISKIPLITFQGKLFHFPTAFLVILSKGLLQIQHLRGQIFTMLYLGSIEALICRHPDLWATWHCWGTSAGAEFLSSMAICLDMMKWQIRNIHLFDKGTF